MAGDLDSKLAITVVFVVLIYGVLLPIGFNVGRKFFGLQYHVLVKKRRPQIVFIVTIIGAFLIAGI